MRYKIESAMTLLFFVAQNTCCLMKGVFNMSTFLGFTTGLFGGLLIGLYIKPIIKVMAKLFVDVKNDNLNTNEKTES